MASTKMSTVQTVPQFEFTIEPIDEDTSSVELTAPINDEPSVDENHASELVMQLQSTMFSGIDNDEYINHAITQATQLLVLLRKQKKKIAKQSSVPKERAKYGSCAPSASALFAKANRQAAVSWYDAGGRVENFNQARKAQIAKYLSDLWKNANDETRAQYKDEHQNYIMRRARIQEESVNMTEVIMNHMSA